MAEDLPEEVVEEMRRRALLAAAGIVLVGEPVPGFGELGSLPGPMPVPPPSRIVGLHVVKVRELTQRLGEGRQAYGSDPQVSSAVAEWASGLLGVSGTEPVKRALLTAVAELHLQAGFDALTLGFMTAHYTITNTGWSWAPRPVTPTVRSLP